MKKFNHCPIIEVGDIFTRVDRNGKVWKAEVINRTEYFVDVKKTQPYQIKVGDEFGWWYEDAPATFERCMLYRHYAQVEDGETEEQGLFGSYKKKNYKKVATAIYYIDCKEVYSKYYNYDKCYKLKKYGDGVDENNEPAEEALNKFFNYCEGKEWEDD